LRHLGRFYGKRVGSGVQFHDVAGRERMLAPDLLSVESGRTPDARVTERAREVFVHEPRDVLHGLASPKGEGPIAVGRVARQLGVDPHDAEVSEEPGADLAEAMRAP